MPSITANAVELYYEVRGTGPAVLLIHGGGGDSGTLSGLAEILASNFMVVAYDRRGLSRSPRPIGWKQTSVEEQTEDAAQLLRALGIAPAAVVGGSLGALIALELLLRHPDFVRRASLLDPGPLESVIPDRRRRMAPSENVQTAMAEGGPKARFEALLRDLDVWDHMDSGTQQRLVGNAEVFFGPESSLLQSYRPDEALLRANRVPVQVGVGKDTPPVFQEMAVWLASQLKVPAETYPGGHAAALNHPVEVADVILPFLQHVVEDQPGTG